MSPKGTLKVVDDRTLAFAEIASPQTLENLRRSPYVDINIMDPFRRIGWRFRGRAEIDDDPDLMRFLGEGLGAEYPLRHGVRIHVDETHQLTSPIYWVHGLSEQQVVAMWERKLGYRRSAPAANGAVDTRAGV